MPDPTPTYSKKAKAMLSKGGLVEDSKKVYEKNMKRFTEYLTDSVEINYDGKRPFTSVDVVNYIANEANRVAPNTLVSYVSHLKHSWNVLLTTSILKNSMT